VAWTSTHVAEGRADALRAAAVAGGAERYTDCGAAGGVAAKSGYCRGQFLYRHMTGVSQLAAGAATLQEIDRRLLVVG
jgi:hypothetical protein